MAKRVKRTYGLPFTGYRSDVAPDAAPPGAMTINSRDWGISNAEGQIYLRMGYQLAGETLTSRTGLLERAWKSTNSSAYQSAPYCRNMLAVQYPYTDTQGNQTPTTLPTMQFTDDDELYRMGCALGVTKGGTYKVLGSDFSQGSGASRTYTTSASTEVLFKCIPMPCITRGGAAAGTAVSSGVLYNRCVHEYHRRLLTAGSWKMFQSGRWVFFPNLHGTPMKWDKGINADGTSATERVRIQPWGNQPPLNYPKLETTDVTADATNKVFYQYDVAFVTVMFEYEDGSFSMPCQHNSTTPWTIAVTGGSAIGATATYSSIKLTGIPIGPAGVARRIILASDWVNIGTAAITANYSPPGGNATSGNTVAMVDTSINNLKVIGIVGNNTDTSFILRSRLSGAQAATAIRDDHMWPLPSRYAFEMERRVGVGYSRKVNPCAMIMAPLTRKGAAALYDCNLADDSASLYGASANALRLFRSTVGAYTLYTKQGDIGASTNYSETALTTINTVALASCTLQDLEDTVYPGGNSNLTDGGGWGIHKAPGVDGNILVSNLQPTVFQVASCTVGATGALTTTATSPYDFSDVALGMRCRVVSGAGSGAISTANAIVIKKVSNTSVILGTVGGDTATTVAGTANANVLEFWSDTGDDGWNTNASWTGTYGNVRAYGPTFPAVLAFTGRYMDSVGVDKQRIMYTSATPGQASMAAQSFFNNKANLKSAPSNSGVFMGSAPLGQSNVLAYSRSIYVLANRKGGTSGEDQDYHAYPLNLRRGVMHHGTLAHGNGWVGYLTPDGYAVTDGEREVIISGALYDPGTGNGVMNGKQNNYTLNTAMHNWGDDDDPQKQTYFACVHNNALNLSFIDLPSASIYMPMVRAQYSFAPGAENYGLAQMLRNGSEPWGWSSPFCQRVGCMVSMPNGFLYAAHDKQGGVVDVFSNTVDGTLWKMDCQNTTTQPYATFDEVLTLSGTGALDATLNTLTFSQAASCPIGAKVTGSGITGTATITAKSGSVLTLSGTLSTTASGSYVIYGYEVGVYNASSVGAAGTAKFCKDWVEDTVNKKSAVRLTIRYASGANTTLSLQLKGDTRNTGQASVFSLSGIGIDSIGNRNLVSQKNLSIPMSRRGEYDTFAASVSASNPSLSGGTNPPYVNEVYGIEAEYDVHESPR